MRKKEFLKESVEYRCRKRLLNMYVIIYCLLLLVMIPVLVSDWETYLIVISIMFVMFLPFALYAAYLLYRISKNFDNYTFHDVKLEYINSSFYGRVFFKITIEHKGKLISFHTKSLFSTHTMDLIYIPLEDYINRTVKIAFNPFTEEVIIIKKV